MRIRIIGLALIIVTGGCRLRCKNKQEELNPVQMRQLVRIKQKLILILLQRRICFQSADGPSA